MMRRCVLWSSPSAHTRPLPSTFATGGLNEGDFTVQSNRRKKERKKLRQCLRVAKDPETEEDGACAASIQPV